MFCCRARGTERGVVWRGLTHFLLNLPRPSPWLQGALLESVLRNNFQELEIKSFSAPAGTVSS